MKKLFFVVCMLLSTLLKAQIKEPSADVTLDFCRNIYFQTKLYNNDNLRATCYLVGRKLGYQLSDIEEAIENLTKNKKFRDELQRQIAEIYRDREMLTLNLISIGMRATNAKKLAAYLVNKYVILSSTNNALKPTFALPEPEQLLKITYKVLVDSLKKKKMYFKIDPTFGEGVFYGYTLRTSDGEYFLSNKYDVRSYGFQIYQPIEVLRNYFYNKGAINLKEGGGGYNEGSSYYILSYRGYILEINRTGDTQTRIVYEKK